MPRFARPHRPDAQPRAGPHRVCRGPAASRLLARPQGRIRPPVLAPCGGARLERVCAPTARCARLGRHHRRRGSDAPACGMPGGRASGSTAAPRALGGGGKCSTCSMLHLLHLHLLRLHICCAYTCHAYTCHAYPPTAPTALTRCAAWSNLTSPAALPRCSPQEPPTAAKGMRQQHSSTASPSAFASGRTCTRHRCTMAGPCSSSPPQPAPSTYLPRCSDQGGQTLTCDATMARHRCTSPQRTGRRVPHHAAPCSTILASEPCLVRVAHGQV